MAHDREIAGIRCTEILDGLSEWMANVMSLDDRDRVQAHLAECSWCEHFGGELGAVVHQLRVHLAEPERPTDAETGAVLDLLQL